MICFETIFDKTNRTFLLLFCLHFLWIWFETGTETVERVFDKFLLNQDKTKMVELNHVLLKLNL